MGYPSMKQNRCKIRVNSYALLGIFLANSKIGLQGYVGLIIEDKTKPYEEPQFKEVVEWAPNDGLEKFKEMLKTLSKAETDSATPTTIVKRNYKYKISIGKLRAVKNKKMFKKLLLTFIRYQKKQNSYIIIPYFK